jgi:RNA polymerase sigma-70 factor (ECF subfamily)
MSKDEEDGVFVERCRRGDVDAFAVLIDRYQRPVFNAVYHIVRSYEDAREVAQQVFMKIYQHLDSFHGDGRFFSWVYRTAINEAINHVKSRREVELLDEESNVRRDSAEHAQQIADSARDVHDAVMRLKREYREVVVLRHFLDYSYRDAAELLHLSEKTVKSRLFTARQLLRQSLAAQGYKGARP